MVNCGKGEGAHAPAQCAGKFFFRGTGLPTVMRKNQPLVPRSNFWGKVCARTAPWFRGQTLPVPGHGGGGGVGSNILHSRFPHPMLCSLCYPNSAPLPLPRRLHTPSVAPSLLPPASLPTAPNTPKVHSFGNLRVTDTQPVTILGPAGLKYHLSTALVPHCLSAARLPAEPRTTASSCPSAKEGPPAAFASPPPAPCACLGHFDDGSQLLMVAFEGPVLEALLLHEGSPVRMALLELARTGWLPPAPSEGGEADPPAPNADHAPTPDCGAGPSAACQGPPAEDPGGVLQQLAALRARALQELPGGLPQHLQHVLGCSCVLNDLQLRDFSGDTAVEAALVRRYRPQVCRPGPDRGVTPGAMAPGATPGPAVLWWCEGQWARMVGHLLCCLRAFLKVTIAPVPQADPLVAAALQPVWRVSYVHNFGQRCQIRDLLSAG